MARLPRPDQSRAVLIGISRYAHLEALPAIDNNLADLRALLTDPDRGFLTPDRCAVLADPHDPRAVFRALRTQARSAEDTLLVYFAGHGLLGTRNELHLALRDADREELPYTTLAYDQVREAMLDSPARNRIVILDCCFAGRAISAMAAPEDAVAGQVTIEGTYILAATTATATALAPPGASHTAFTGALLELLDRGDPAGPEYLTLAQLYPRLRTRLQGRGHPTPRQQGTDTVTDLALTRNPAHQPPPKPVPPSAPPSVPPGPPSGASSAPPSVPPSAAPWPRTEQTRSRPEPPRPSPEPPRPRPEPDEPRREPSRPPPVPVQAPAPPVSRGGAPGRTERTASPHRPVVTRRRTIGIVGGAVVAVVGIAVAAQWIAPNHGATNPGASTGATVTRAAREARTATDVGGMAALVAAARTEGTLNVVALPADWAGYGTIISAFHQKYGITVASSNPDGSSLEEVNAVKSLRGTPGAPDVLDLGSAVAAANATLFAPYQVARWGDIPAAQKEPSGLWVGDYGGFMSIGYDSAKVPRVTSLQDLLTAGFAGKVAINGDPTQAFSALQAVIMVALGNGGSLDDVTRGLDFFHELRQKGNYLPIQATVATIKNGTTPVVLDWDYINAAHVRDVPGWKVVVPGGAVVGSLYYQAINKDAPHPAAARLWEEFLYSDEGQNLWLRGGTHPVREQAMRTAGTLDAAAAARLPKVPGTPVFPTADQVAKAQAVVKERWSATIG